MATFSKRAVATLLVNALLGVAIGCSKHSNDETIAQDVQSKVAADPVTKDAALNVAAKDGKVTLKGTVKDSETQQRVEQIAREEPGARVVSDETAVVTVRASEQSLNTTTPAPPTIEQSKPEPSPRRDGAHGHGEPSFKFQD